MNEGCESREGNKGSSPEKRKIQRMRGNENSKQLTSGDNVELPVEEIDLSDMQN
jgi:hypothetical protein